MGRKRKPRGKTRNAFGADQANAERGLGLGAYRGGILRGSAPARTETRVIDGQEVEVTVCPPANAHGAMRQKAGPGLRKDPGRKGRMR